MENQLHRMDSGHWLKALGKAQMKSSEGIAIFDEEISKLRKSMSGSWIWREATWLQSQQGATRSRLKKLTEGSMRQCRFRRRRWHKWRRRRWRGSWRELEKRRITSWSSFYHALAYFLRGSRHQNKSNMINRPLQDWKVLVQSSLQQWRRLTACRSARAAPHCSWGVLFPGGDIWRRQSVTLWTMYQPHQISL